MTKNKEYEYKLETQESSILTMPTDELLTIIPLNVSNEIDFIAVNENTNRIYASALVPNSLIVIDGDSDTVIATINGDISVGDGPRGIAVNPVTNKIYVAQGRFPTRIIVVDGNTNTITGRVTIADGPCRVAVNPVTNKIYATNSYSNLVSLIDGNNNSLVSTIASPGSPYCISVNSYTNKIYVSHIDSNNISVIDGNTFTVTTSVTVGTKPTGIAINPDNNHIYVGRTGFLTIIDGNTNTVIKDIPITGNGLTDGSGIGFNTLTHKIYISPGVDIIDETDGIIQTIPGGWRSLGINGNTGKVYAADGRGMMVIQPTTGDIEIASNPLGAKIIIDSVDSGLTTPSVIQGLHIGTHTYKLTLPGYVESTGTFDILAGQLTTLSVTLDQASIDRLLTTIHSNSIGVYGIAINENTNRIYASILNPNALAVIDGDNDTIISTISGAISAGDGPRGVAVNPVTNKIYVTQGRFPTQVIVVDGNTNTIIKVITAVGDGQAGIAVNHITNKIYFANYYSSLVSVIDGDSDTLTSTISAPGAYGVSVNSSTNKIYIANFDSDTILVIDGNTFTVIKTITVGSVPRYISIDEDNNKIYVGCLGFLTTIDGNTDTVIKDLPITGNGGITDGEGVGINKITNKIYVSPGVDIIDKTDGIIQTIPGGFRQLAVNEKTGKIYVAEYAYNITVIQTITGDINIASSPAGAKITIDNIDTGKVTPDTITGLFPISHTYKLTLPGYVDSTGMFDIASEQLAVLSVTLDRAGYLYMSSIPLGAKIFIDDVEQTGIVTPTIMQGLHIGTHTYKLTSSGYEDKTDTFVITADQITTIQATLIPLPPGTGSLNISSTPPGAEIYIDDNSIPSGITSVTIPNLSAGTHIYRLTLSGYYDLVGVSNITPSQTTNLSLAMTPLPPTVGSLYMSSTPISAEIFIDDIDQGVTTPYIVPNLAPGNHVYKLTLGEYYDVTGQFTVTAGQTTSVIIQLTQIPPGPGSLNVSSTPPGAEIFIDNVDQEKVTPVIIADISQGYHTYKLTLAGYYDLAGVFNISSGQATNLSLAMTPLPIMVGYLYISSTPIGAKIFIDDVEQIGKTTPTEIYNLSIGTHTYKLTLTGYHNITGSFDIIAGQIAIVETELVLLIPTGYLYISSIPLGAKIFIDDIEQVGNVTPAEMYNLSTGTHTYKLTLTGYHDITESFDIMTEKITIIEVILTPLVPATGYLYISSIPTGAKILIDDIDTGKIAPTMISDLSPGSHSYKLKLPKYKDEIGTFDVASDQITVIYKELIKLSVGCQPFTSSTKAEIYIDDIDTTFKTPKNICYSPLGDHTFRLDGTFTILPPPKPSCQSFDSNHRGAKIFIDNIDTGKVVPSRICNITSGNHTFSIRGTVKITK